MAVNKRYDVIWPQRGVSTVSGFSNHVWVGFHELEPFNDFLLGEHAIPWLSWVF